MGDLVKPTQFLQAKRLSSKYFFAKRHRFACFLSSASSDNSRGFRFTCETQRHKLCVHSRGLSFAFNKPVQAPKIASSFLGSAMLKKYFFHLSGARTEKPHCLVGKTHWNTWKSNRGNSSWHEKSQLEGDTKDRKTAPKCSNKGSRWKFVVASSCNLHSTSSLDDSPLDPLHDFGASVYVPAARNVSFVTKNVPQPSPVNEGFVDRWALNMESFGHTYPIAAVVSAGDRTSVAENNSQHVSARLKVCQYRPALRSIWTCVTKKTTRSETWYVKFM